MSKKHRVIPSKYQDILNKGLLRIKGGKQVNISYYGTTVNASWEKFAKKSKQDKLEEGLIKFNDNDKGYISIDKIEEIESYDCFVATVVYGNIDAPQVRTLREFRDDVLMQSLIGRAFVDFYYSGVGEKTADFIKEHLPSAIPAIRRGLDVLVEGYSRK